MSVRLVTTTTIVCIFLGATAMGGWMWESAAGTAALCWFCATTELG